MRIASTLRVDSLRAAIVAGAAGLVALAFAVSSTGAQSGAYSITLSGAEEVPAVSSSATGSFQATISGNSINYTLTATGTGLTMAHFHNAAAGVNGPVVAFLFGPNQAGVDSINETGTITVEDLSGPFAGDWDAFIEALDGGQIYVNVHSIEYPAGVVRGQMPAGQVPAPAATATSSAPAATATAKPPATGTGTAADGGFGFSTWGLVAGAAVALAAGGGLALRRR